MIDDPYKVLGISQNATQDEIKKAYRRKAREYHPDLHPNDPAATQKMNEVNQAYEMLSNPEKFAAQRAQQQRQSQHQPYGGYSQTGASQQNQQRQNGYQGWSSDSGGFTFEEGGSLELDYMVEIRGADMQRTQMTIDAIAL